MNAPRKSVEFEPVEGRLSAREDLARLPLIAPQLMAIGQIAGYFDLPRPANWEDESGEPYEAKPQEPRPSRLRRLFAAVGRRLLPRPRLPHLSEHLCRDIGIDWTPEPPVRNWPW